MAYLERVRQTLRSDAFHREERLLVGNFGRSEHAIRITGLVAMTYSDSRCIKVVRQRYNGSSHSDEGRNKRNAMNNLQRLADSGSAGFWPGFERLCISSPLLTYGIIYGLRRFPRPDKQGAYYAGSTKPPMVLGFVGRFTWFTINNLQTWTRPKSRSGRSRPAYPAQPDAAHTPPGAARHGRPMPEGFPALPVGGERGPYRPPPPALTILQTD